MINILHMRLQSVLLVLLFFLLCCEVQKDISVKIASSVHTIDTIYINELLTDRIITQIPVNENKSNFYFEVPSPVIGVIKSPNEAIDDYLVILTPGENMNIHIDSVALSTTNNIADSLLNYLLKSNNEVVGQVFSLGSSNDVISVFDSLALRRKDIITSKKHLLTTHEFEILNFQNEARIYSFLFYYGRLMRNFTPANPFFSFINKVDNNLEWNKTLPTNLLYKYEIQYLRSSDSIQNISSFLDFIEHQTNNKDLAAFLKMFYLNDVIDSPSYWKQHVQLFNTENINHILEKEKANPYYSLVQVAANSFYASQKGEKAFNFTAMSEDNKQINLSDFKGKLVFMDVWATWCGPCISQKPAVLKIAEKYKNNSGIVFLMISMDSSRERWEKYLAKRKDNPHVQELFIEDGMYSEFGNKYNVKSIPKYIMIDKNGLIINSNVAEPSSTVDKIISEHL